MRKFGVEINRDRIRRGPHGSDESIGRHGCFMIQTSPKSRLFCIVTDGGDTGWEHVSVHAQYQNRKGKIIQRIPTWLEMHFIKERFWGDDEVVIQIHPKAEDYVNDCEYALHLWKPRDLEVPTPPKEFV